MKTKLGQFLREEWLQVLLLLIPIIAALAALPFATHRVPMQWGLDGRVNWTAPKEWGLLVMPASLVLVFGLMMFFERRDPRRRAEDGTLTAHGKATRTLRHGLSVLLGGVTFIQIAAALGRHPDVSHLVPAGVALMFAFIGNLFGKLKPNRYAGIRIPWTMNSEFVWRQTHRAAGWLWTMSGIIVAAISLFASPRVLVGVTIPWIVLLIAAPLFVAWRAHRQEQAAAQPPQA